MNDVDLAGVPLSSPVLAAAGCAGSGAEMQRVTDLSVLGAVITRSVTGAPRAGTPLPRLVESPSGLVNALGLPGPGVDRFVDEELPELMATGATVIVSIWADSTAEHGRIAQRLRQIQGIAAIEVNLSHPSGGTADPAAVIHQVRRNTAAPVPVLAKLGSDVTVPLARSCVAAGADGLSLINAVPAVAIDAAAGHPALGTVPGGLSGPAIRPIALRAVWQVHEAIPEIPIVASGGVTTGADALEFLLAGATAVAVGTALLNDPGAGPRIADELHTLVAGRTLSQIRGTAHGRIP
ncbi:MAG: hypothetical protein V9E98_09510 [Candidatus Nanopelagicales bacterium]